MRGDGRNQLQIPAPLPFKNIFRMIPLSAQSISLDSPFNIYNLFEKGKDDIKGVHYGKNCGSGIAD
jgi:hypothetical protein